MMTSVSCSVTLVPFSVVNVTFTPSSACSRVMGTVVRRAEWSDGSVCVCVCVCVRVGEWAGRRVVMGTVVRGAEWSDESVSVCVCVCMLMGGWVGGWVGGDGHDLAQGRVVRRICVCVRACACVCVHMRACACVRVCCMGGERGGGWVGGTSREGLAVLQHGGLRVKHEHNVPRVLHVHRVAFVGKEMPAVCVCVCVYVDKCVCGYECGRVNVFLCVWT